MNRRSEVLVSAMMFFSFVAISFACVAAFNGLFDMSSGLSSVACYLVLLAIVIKLEWL